MNHWPERILEDDESIRALLQRTRRIAVLGIKPETRSHKPAFYVPRFLQQAGYEIVPVPVYYPEVTRILGEPVYRRLADVPGPVDLVDVFRRPEDIPPHVPDILASRPAAVWFQLGIRNDEAARELARAGILVVQDRCLMVEHNRLIAHRSGG
jgi:predicted CoA-binding protein